MEEMKFVENPKVNDKVVEMVETLKEDIISNFHPKSIILSGSFGKGEVTVIEEKGRLKFLSDCEVIIISNKIIFNRDKIEQFSKRFYEKTSLKVDMGGIIMSAYLQLPFLSRKLKPTMENYDLKYGSKILYGKDYLEKIPNFKPEDIPLGEGIRLLFNRMAESLEHFSVEKPSEEMVFWTDKIVLACQDALLLSLGKYHYSYRKRNEMLQNLFQEHFSELEGEIPNFLDLTLEATERKLNGTKNVDDPIRYWFDTAKICDKVFRYVIKKDMGIEFNTYLEFQEKYTKHLDIKKKYYREFISSLLYQNLMVLIKIMLVHKRFVSPKVISAIGIPWKRIIYSSVPLIYFGVLRNGEINEAYLKKVRGILSWFKELKDSKYNFSEYEYVKEHVLDLWRCIC